MDAQLLVRRGLGERDAGSPPPGRVSAVRWLLRIGVVLGLLVVIVLCLFHAAHRIRFTSEELFGIARYDLLIAVLCYGGAIVGGVTGALLLF